MSKLFSLSVCSYIFKLADFGAARNVDLDDGAPKSIVGTPEYLVSETHLYLNAAIV